MEIKLLYEPNFIFETAVLFYNYKNGQSCLDLKNALQRKFSIDPQILASCFDAMIELQDYVIGSLDTNSEDFNFLFTRHSGMKGCFAFYLLHDVMRSPKPDLDAGLNELKNLTKPYFFINFTSLLLEEFYNARESGKEEIDEINNYNDLIVFIETLKIPSDEKWALCSFFNNFEKYRGLLAEIIKEAAAAFVEKYDLVKHYTGWFVTGAGAALSGSAASEIESDPVAFVKENYGAEVTKLVNCLYLQPSIMMCNSTRYLMNYTSEDDDDFLYVGALFEPLREITESATQDDRLCRNLRVLGDLRKFEILELLSEEPKYGQQISQLLDISTATVSHHMALLIDSGFVETQRDSNRIYYRINKKRIGDFINELSETLLKV